MPCAQRPPAVGNHVDRSDSTPCERLPRPVATGAAGKRATGVSLRLVAHGFSRCGSPAAGGLDQRRKAWAVAWGRLLIGARGQPAFRRVPGCRVLNIPRPDGLDLPEDARGPGISCAA